MRERFMREGEVRDLIMRGVAVLLLAVLASTSYWYSIMIRKPGTVPTPPPTSPDVVVDQLAVTQFDERGRARYRLFAQQLMHFAATDDMTLTQPRLLTLYPDRPQVEARSQNARLENNGERVLMTGNVLITRAAEPDTPALTLRTEALTAWPDDDRYVSDVRTELEQGQGAQHRLTQADRMVFDNVQRDIQMSGSVHTVIAPRPANEPLKK